ncbi:hypothetical protein GCM10009799_31190 [Nocardiopsis rhodophaea]|uniref:Uncharacterized protein n=1 Tax=Nocardiopsis rhodophaea TaxID=280238 RepID=A0ABN2T8L5_9ACTN
MSVPVIMTDADWSGGHYEIYIELGDTDDGRLQRLLTSVWRAAAVDGCYGATYDGPGELQEMPCTVASLRDAGKLKGVVRHPSGQRIVCGCFVIHDDDVPELLSFFIPMGALTAVDPRIGAFPFGPDGGLKSLVWRHPLDEWLADIARAVFNDVGFRLSTIGFELLEAPHEALHGGVPPEERWNAFLISDGGELQYFPANR